MTESRRFLPFWIVLAALLAAPDPSPGEAYLTATTGYRCSQCHVNRTGGGMRTGYGALFAQTHLPMWGPESLAGDGGAGRLLRTGQAGPVRLGGDVRAGHRTVRGSGDREDTNEFDLEQATLYLEASAFQDRVVLYVDESIAPGGATNREAFGLVTFPLKGERNRGWVKVGKFFPPFGLRLLDDRALTRAATGFTFENSDQGIEVGFEPGPWQIALAVTNGTQGAPETNSQKLVSAKGEFVRRRWSAGGSYMHNSGAGFTRDAYGVHGTLGFGRLVLLAEVDYVDDKFDDHVGREDEPKLAALVESRFWIRRGQNIRLTWDVLDPNRDVATNTRERFTVGYEGFLLPNLQLRANAVFQQAPPQQPEFRDDSLDLELHVFF